MDAALLAPETRAISSFEVSPEPDAALQTIRRESAQRQASVAQWGVRQTTSKKASFSIDVGSAWGITVLSLSIAAIFAGFAIQVGMILFVSPMELRFFTFYRGRTPSVYSCCFYRLCCFLTSLLVLQKKLHTGANSRLR